MAVGALEVNGSPGVASRPEPLSRLRGLAPPVGDALLAAVFVVASLFESVLSDTSRPPVVHALIAVPTMAGLAWRRRWPTLVAVAVVCGNIAINPNGQFSTLLAMVLVSFTVGAELDPPRAWWALGLIAGPFLGVLYVEGLEPSDVAATLVFIVGPFAVGRGNRVRLARLADAVARAERLERQQAEQAAAAVAEERARIARELHDIVSHSLSVVTIQTQAVRLRLKPDQVREERDLAAVETTARQALGEMRRLFGVLRTDGDPLALAPQPGLGELDALIEQVRSAGLDVRLAVEGDRRELPPGADLAAYRIVQEGLTNVLRHAGARHAWVTLSYDEEALVVVVEDDGRGPGGATPGGHGLVGVRERVALYGGHVETGTREGRSGFRLSARLPWRERA